MSLFPSLLAAITGAALAQTNPDEIQPLEIEYRKAQVDETIDDRLQTRVFFETQWYEYNNLDFRSLDESSDQAILDSDDRGSLAFTGVATDLAYKVDDRTRFVLGVSHRGLWGNDQIGNVNIYGGFLYFTALYVDTRFGGGDRQVRMRVGRQFFDLGANPGARDYAMAGIHDMVRIDVPLSDKLNVIAIPINAMGSSVDPAGADFVSFIGQSAFQTFNFRGDRMTRRHGLVVELNEVGDWFSGRAYGFYTDVGAVGTGSDISYNGLLGNFSDNDWVLNYGVRGMGDFGVVRPWAEWHGSAGIDRKELVARDANTNGFAWGAGVSVRTGSALSDEPADDELGLRAEVSYFDAFGSLYGSDGLLRSHGYVGLKGHHAGGTLFNRFLGFHPAPYVGRFGLNTSEHDRTRRAGTRVLHARAGFELPGPVSFSTAWWMLQDTGLTELDMGKLQTITPPFGYAREEFAAQQRLGGVIGHELNLDVGVKATDSVDIFGNAAVIVPGDYYGTVVARVAGTALGSADPQTPWGVNIGTRLKF